MKSFFIIAAASLLAASAWAADADVNPDKGAELYEATCAACHGPNGNSTVPAQPKLSQQHPEYLVKQLQEFKSGKRESAIMQGFASMLSDEDALNIATWLSQQKAEPGMAQDAELVADGERIYRGGIMDRHIPACAACHSPNGAGMPSQYPRLAGQFAEYTATELKAFRDDSRANSDVMHGVAKYMTDKEIAAVAEYISGQQ